MLGIDGYAVLLCFYTLTLSISISESSQGSAPISWYLRDTGDCVIFCSNALFIIHLMNGDILFQLRCLSCLSLGASVLGNVLSAGVTAGSALFPNRASAPSSCICQKTKHWVARGCASPSRYANARPLGSLAAVALPCLVWTSSSKEGPATRYFRLLGAPKSHLSMPCSLAAAYPLIRCRLSGRYITAFCDSVLRCVTNRLWLLQPYLRAHFHSQRGKRFGLVEVIDCSEQEEATAKPFSHVHKVSIFPSRLMITVTPRGALQAHRFIPRI